MIKFIHAADVHLDSPLRGLERHDSAPVDAIRGATRRAFENLVELAIEERVAFVLLAGDLFDGNWNDFRTAIFLARELGRLGEHNIKVFFVAGNHDAESKITKALEKPANMMVFPSRKPHSEVLKDLEVAIHGQSFAGQHIDENLAAGFPTALPGMFNIGLLHTSLDGREGHADYAPCSLDDLRSKGYQYWALGHVHQREQVSQDPWVVFPGCLQGRHARETGPKGCCLVTIADGEVEDVQWRDLDVLRWTRCTIDLADIRELSGVLEAARSALDQELRAADGRPVATRVRLEGTCPIHNELVGKTFWLKQRLTEIAAEVGGDELWIEKVELATTSTLDMDAVLAGQSSTAELYEQILAVSETTEAVSGLDNIVREFRNKLPPAVFETDVGLDLGDPEVIGRLVREAKRMLLDKLLHAGGES